MLQPPQATQLITSPTAFNPSKSHKPVMPEAIPFMRSELHFVASEVRSSPHDASHCSIRGLRCIQATGIPSVRCT